MQNPQDPDGVPADDIDEARRFALAHRMTVERALELHFEHGNSWDAAERAVASLSH